MLDYRSDPDSGADRAPEIVELVAVAGSTDSRPCSSDSRRRQHRDPVRHSIERTARRSLDWQRSHQRPMFLAGLGMCYQGRYFHNRRTDSQWQRSLVHL